MEAFDKEFDKILELLGQVARIMKSGLGSLRLQLAWSCGPAWSQECGQTEVQK